MIKTFPPVLEEDPDIGWKIYMLYSGLIYLASHHPHTLRSVEPTPTTVMVVAFLRD